MKIISKSSRNFSAGWIAIGLAASAMTGLLPGPALAAPSRVQQPVPGGIDPRPVMISQTNSGGHLTVWCGGYQGGPFQMVVASNLPATSWKATGGIYTNNSFTVVLTNLGGTAFHRVSGPLPEYAGASGGLGCGQCHSLSNEGQTPIDYNYDLWLQTPHAGAYQTLIQANPANATNASCLPCHTVAYNYPGGYTPGNTVLEGVQCESCHGPGGVRHRSGGDKAPAIERSAMVCGGCHDSSRYLTYGEWKSSGHSRTEAHVADRLQTSTAALYQCGSCHSGAMRSFLMSPWASAPPTGEEAAREGIVCVACHDPHRATANGYQLRNPLYSTNAYSVTPATNQAGFAAQYKANINLCGQCHNARGALWTDTSRPPHASPQYNLLIGSAGEVLAGDAKFQPGAHGLLIDDQCVGCHMPTTSPVDGKVGDSGHRFAVASFDRCMTCHPYPEMLIDFTRYAVGTQIQEIKSALDLWATTRAPEALRAKYGAKAWEYSYPGELSNAAGNTDPGPTNAEQAQVPDDIKKARFNLYLVLHDGSFGVHNGPYSITLLDAARTWVAGQLR